MANCRETIRTILKAYTQEEGMLRCNPVKSQCYSANIDVLIRVKGMVRCLILSLCIGSIFSNYILAQTHTEPLVSQMVDNAKVVTLHGNVHPSAQARYDQGAVPDSFSAQRMFLILNRSTKQEAALSQYLHEVHQRGSVNYHQWLTPQQFGERFGPDDSDVDATVSWLRSEGFTISRVTKSKMLVEFSGTAGLLRNAFHAEIHQYNVQGEMHYANAGELSIPEALAPLVHGVSSLNDFHAKPYIKIAGRALYSRSTKRTTPQWTMPNPLGTSNPYAYALAPEDFVTQYDLAPLYQSGINGSGQTIGIINESNIDLSLVSSYQQLFNLPNNPTQIVIDGDDPGTISGVAVEAYLDVEVSGSVAPKATVNLYIAGSDGLQDPLALAAVRAIEDNQASVLSVSFGNCEDYLGSSGNQLWAELWEQAAAQGQTVLVAAGDDGATCNKINLSVSGVASTPWDIAVGGTDFYYSDYATGAVSEASLWNKTNDPNLGSLKAPLPEQVWNDPFGMNIIHNSSTPNQTSGGGGGASGCITQSSTTHECLSGYSKPAWQIGPGIPADGVRDLPDVSLFASNGANLSFYPICAYEGECAVGIGSVTSLNSSEILAVGGTSGSTPAMAGIMALVNQKYGRQGQANFTLYPLAKQKPSAFHDIFLGNNDGLCSQGNPNCGPSSSIYYTGQTTVYQATPNYDLASGLGSVDAAVMVNNWNAISFMPTSTKLQLSASNITHGTPINVLSIVTATSGSGTPTGDVAILTNDAQLSSQSQFFQTLVNGSALDQVNFLPGGYYYLTASYAGDEDYGSSTSSPVALTVNPEPSKLDFSFVSGQTVSGAGSSVVYNAPLTMMVQPTGISGQSGGIPTGMATFKLDSNASTVPLNAIGTASWTPPALAIGIHSVSASYSGDASYEAGSTTPVSFNVNKGVVSINYSMSGPLDGYGDAIVDPNGTLTLSVEVEPEYSPSSSGTVSPLGTVSPTGTVTVCLSTIQSALESCYLPNYTQSGTLISPIGNNNQYSVALMTFKNLAAGYYWISLVYSGDSVWQGAGESIIGNAVWVYSFNPTPVISTTVLTITPSSIAGSETATLSATVTGPVGAAVAPTGQVTFFDSGSSPSNLQLNNLISSSTTASATFTGTFPVSTFWNNGDNQIIAVYSGDSNYLPSSSTVTHLSVTQGGGDFTIAPQIPQVSVQAGSSGSIGLNLASLSNFSSTVTFTCTPSASNLTCAVNPSTIALNGTATTTLTINAAARTAGLSTNQGILSGIFYVASSFLLASCFLVGVAGRRRSFAISLSLFAAMIFLSSCGGTKHLPPPLSGATYSVVVTATANGFIHNTKIAVIVL